MLRPKTNGHEHDPFAHSLGHRKHFPKPAPKPPVNDNKRPVRCLLCGLRYDVNEHKCCPSC